MHDVSDHNRPCCLSSEQLGDASESVLPCNVPDVESDGVACNLHQLEAVLSRHCALDAVVVDPVDVPIYYARLACRKVRKENE